MRHAKHVKEGKRNAGVYAILFVVLLCVILTVALIVRHIDKKATPSPNAEPPTVADEGAEPADSLSEAAAPELGELLESGSGLNENYFSAVDYFGTASDLTDESFFLGKAGMAFDKNAQPVFPAIVVHYGEDTVVKTAILYNTDDRYEIYASGLDELKQRMEGKEFLNSVSITLEDAGAEELWAKEIIVEEYADLG